ncbi:MAG: hypothetical protein GY696_10210 [Gammaproteobacteria bacterium]|nr:hypothetical protein [Gammaproteobacteria bacterium]
MDRTSNMGMHDSSKKHLVPPPEVMKDKMTREAIQNLEPKEQWEHLDRTFLSRSRQIMRIVKENFLSTPILDLDETFVTAVNTLEPQLVELKQLRVKKLLSTGLSSLR